MERYSQNYSFVVPSVILDTQMATKSVVFSSYFVFTVFIPRVTFLVELQIQLHTREILHDYYFAKNKLA